MKDAFMSLIRVCPDTFKAIEIEWSAQCDGFGEDFSEFAAPSILHAKEIANGRLLEKQYAIYALKTQNEHHLIAHFNVAPLPKTEGTTLRIVWVLLAPKYDFADVTADRLANLASDLFASAIELSSENGSGMQADHVKVHLGNIADRRFFAGMAYALKGRGAMTDIAIRGNWLHMSHRRSETKC